MKTTLSLLAQFIATVFAAEFAAGFVHWLEDAYIRDHTPLVGRLVGRPNTVHHHYPRYMTRHNWWQSSWDLVLLAALLVAGAWCFGLLTWHVWLFAILAANANEFHKWEHRTRKENGRVISFLQDIKILQTARHHALHHTDPKNSHYCTITNFLNPSLTQFDFGTGLNGCWPKPSASSASRTRPCAAAAPGRPGWGNLAARQRHAVPFKVTWMVAKAI